MDKSFGDVISILFAARDAAHTLHLATKSFARHVALGDLYESLVEYADELAEMYQGKYGILNLRSDHPQGFNTTDPLSFIRALASWVELTRQDATDSFIQNKLDELLADVYRAKYKLENLA